MNSNETGIVAICTGAGIFLFGVMVMFDKALMIAGNFIIIVGLGILLNSKAFSLFELDKMLGMAMFILGIISLLLKYTVLGFLLETIGLIYVFKKSVPSFRATLLRLFYGKLLKAQ